MMLESLIKVDMLVVFGLACWVTLLVIAIYAVVTGCLNVKEDK